MMMYANKATSCKRLLQEYENLPKPLEVHKLRLEGVDGSDVYNISGAFESGGETYIAGRVEKRDSEVSCVRFFRKISEYVYTLVPDVRLQRVQDPFVSRMDGDLIVGGTQIDVDPADERKIVNWRTVFMRGKDIYSLRYWFSGPCRMKDVRIFDCGEDVLLLSRPQGGKAMHGKIGMLTVKKGVPISERMIEDAPLFACHFNDDEWGGANEIFALKNGKFGVLGHIAYLSGEGADRRLHYHCMVFALDAKERKCTKVKIIARRADFEDGPAKRDDLRDVLFSGGLVRMADGTAKLFTGVSDCEAHMAILKDPFTEYEEE